MIMEENTLKYIKNAKKTLLSREREVELATIIRSFKTGKQREKAVHELINHNLLLVVKLAFYYSKKTGICLDDLIGAGNVGLSRAAELFDPSRFHTKFSTYATFWIIEEILSLVNFNHPVTIPSYILDYKRKHEKLLQDGPLNDKDLMERLNVNEQTLARIKMADTTSVSLDKPVQNDKGTNKESLLKDIMEDESTVSPTKKAEEDSEFAVLYSAINELDEVSRNIVLARYLSNDEGQLKKLGKKFNLSAERVRQINKKALDKLRKKITEKRINERH